MVTATKPEVFIIESLGFDDERDERYEGRIISSILALSGKKCEYFYIRTERELEHVLKRFAASRYRYLHLSCHGDERGKGMHTTLDYIPFTRLGGIVGPYLRDRRLFVSACSMVNHHLAGEVMPESGCVSILGPDETVGFNDAAILWASLYHVMFMGDEAGMKKAVLRAKALEVANMYRVRLNYFGRASWAKRGYIRIPIVPRREVVPGGRASEKGVPRSIE